MATTNLGKVSVTPKGAFTTGTSYEKLDIVTDQGSGYLSLKDNNPSALPNTTDWQLLAARGTTAYEHAVTAGYTGTEAEFAADCAEVVSNTSRLKSFKNKALTLLIVTITSVSTYTFTSANLNKDAAAVQKAAPIGVSLIDN